MHKRAFAAVAAAFVFSSALLAGGAAADEAAPNATLGATPDAASNPAPSPAPAASAAEAANPAPLIAVPPVSIGEWYDLGAYYAPWLAGDGPVPVAGPTAPTRVAGWAREAVSGDKTGKPGKIEWLAIVIAQVAPGGHAPCSTQATSLDVPDAGSGCLRLRRNADFDHWMQAAQPALYRWVDEHGWTTLPRAWVAYRLPSANGRAVEVQVLFDPGLVEPTLRNTTDFVTSGRPGQQWARQLAAAVSAMNGAAGNAFAVPPFPFAPAPRAAPEAALPDVLPTNTPSAHANPRVAAPASVSDSATPPAVAEQVQQMPPPETPNPD